MRFLFSILLFGCFLIGSSFRKYADDELKAKQVNLLIRQIGHRLLLQAGDSTSRVLPVTEGEKGNFLLRFEQELIFNHDSLIALAQHSFPKNAFPSGYTVTVHDCAKAEIVYGFQINKTEPNITACVGRSQPEGCYTIEFNFPDLYNDEQQKNAAKEQSISSAESDEQNERWEENEPATFGSNSDQLTEGLNSSIAAAQRINPKTGKLKTSTADSVVYGGILLMLGASFLIGRFEKKPKQSYVASNNNATECGAASDYATLGKFFFDPKGQRLILENKVIPLTDKEHKVLELLNNSFGELIPRDTLMQEVWINEGVITGRSLDMFISKLRKKLSADPELRITNVHGKGYRLETVVEFVA